MRLAVCHPQRKYEALNLCRPCYEKQLREVNAAFRLRQLANCTQWGQKNPEKLAAARERDKKRWELRSSDPAFRQRKRELMLLKNYGITQAEYDQMLEKQEGGCAICYRKPAKTPLHVDHNHRTRKVRGLLCHQCNWYLGTIDSDPKIINRLVEYRKNGNKTIRR